MIGKDVAGIIYSSNYDNYLTELTAVRTMGSVPFGGRYRLVDFVLSSMVDFGVSKVAVAMCNNYRSLMDHIGNGRPWDLARKREGLFMLPPYNFSGVGAYGSKMSMLRGAEDFLNHTKEEYILVTDCNVVCNLDIEKLAAFHAENGADITLAYAKGKLPQLPDTAVLKLGDDASVTEMEISPKDTEEGAFAVNIMLLKKSLLLRLIHEASAHGWKDFDRDILMRNPGSLKICGYEIPGFCRVIDSLQSYYDISISLLDKAARDALFCEERPVLTRVRDDMPTVYGIGSSVKNSLIADGCVIEGTVENSVLSRGVRVEKGAVVKNCVLMQETFISSGATANCVITDKNVVLRPGKTLSGAENYTLFISKGKVI
ncbi:MAG: glucose-1-phosphate adenylyltransferase subunit GlgD [Clostridia bacterium]|nr:glucose-1-phosphate adenylyltransferase subunit GlgD [Clostridia bacterium]